MQEKPVEKRELREDIAVGRNAVLELLRSGKPVECVWIQKELEGTVLKIAAIARQQGVVVKQVTRQKLDFLCAHTAHQGG